MIPDTWRQRLAVAYRTFDIAAVAMNAKYSDTTGSASRQLRLTTLIRLRWLAVIGQSVAVVFVGLFLGFPFPVIPCFVLIAGSAILNIYLGINHPRTHLLAPGQSFRVLGFDIVQLSGLLYLTGGMTNPFVFLINVPVVVSATSLPLRLTLALGGLVVLATTFLAFQHMPLPWLPGEEFSVPIIYTAGLWVALVSSLAFTGIYAWRVANEARLLGAALNATELVLQREQHLSALDGLAAAAAHELGTPLATIAVVVREMEKAAGAGEDDNGDIALLRSQTERCREILKRLSSLSTVSEEHLARLPFTSLIEDVVAPHREFGIGIMLEAGHCYGPEPVGHRNPGIIHGLGNLIENAVDFAGKTVHVTWRWDEATVGLTITDDGPGFQPAEIERLGEPYKTGRPDRSAEGGGGLGLGIFIAKTLLERSGATIRFSNGARNDIGAVVRVTWPRKAFDNATPTQQETGN